MIEPPKRCTLLVWVVSGYWQELIEFKSFLVILSSWSLSFKCGLDSFMYPSFTRVSHLALTIFANVDLDIAYINIKFLTLLALLSATGYIKIPNLDYFEQ